MHHINNIPDLETFVLTLTGSSVVDFMCAYCLENNYYFPDKTSINTYTCTYFRQITLRKCHAYSSWKMEQLRRKKLQLMTQWRILMIWCVYINFITFLHLCLQYENTKAVITYLKNYELEAKSHNSILVNCFLQTKIVPE